MRKKLCALLCLLFLLSSRHSACDYYFPAACKDQRPTYDCYCNPCSVNEYTSQTFMFTKPLFATLPARQSGWHNLIHDRHGDIQAAIQIIGMYQQSICHRETPHYFLFDYKSCLKVAGDNTLSTNERDIRAEWLELPSNFEGTFSINPKQKQMGFLIEYNQKLKTILGDCFGTCSFQNAWISISAPFVAVENNLNLRQYDMQNTGTGQGPHDIIEAFNRKDMRFMRLNGLRSTVKLADIKLQFGSTYLHKNNFQLAYYSQFLLSTSPRDCGRYMFEAIAGHNGHYGMGAGVNMQIVLNRENPDYAVCFFTDLDHLFLFKRNQLRTFDLRNKPWSRYLLFNHINRGPDLNLPGTEILTQEVDVHPYSIVDFACGLRLKKCDFELEVGYGIWGHGDERISFVCPFPQGYGIAGQKDGSGIPRTASASTIYNQAANDTQKNDDVCPCVVEDVFVSIVRDDLDCRSAISRSAINHRIHLAISTTHYGRKVDCMFCGGAYYEIPQRNSALKVWGLWGKMGASF